MENLKLSKYNYVIENDTNYVVFNSLTGNIVRFSDKEKMSQILNDSDTTDETYRNICLDKGILISSDTDENEIVKLNHLDLVTDSSLFLTIIPTFLCNFRCKYCYEDFENKSMDEDIMNRITKYLAKSINQYSHVTVDWFGGEPLIKKDIIAKLSEQLIDICHTKYKRYMASMTTNGYLLDYDTFLMMLKSRVYSFQITLDGFDYIHNKYRVLKNGGGSFDTILKNLLEIKNRCKSAYVKIVIRTNVNNELLPILDEYLQFLYENFGDDRRFSFLLRPVGDWGGEAVKNIKSQIISSLDNVYDVMIHSQYKLNYEIYHYLLMNSMCFASQRNSYVINPRGIIHKCTMLFHDDDNTIGYLEENGDMVLDKQKLSKWVHYFTDIPDKCDDCINLSRCYNSSCPATRNKKEHISCGYENRHMGQTLRLLTDHNKKYNFIYDV